MACLYPAKKFTSHRSIQRRAARVAHKIRILKAMWAMNLDTKLKTKPKLKYATRQYGPAGLV